MSDPGTIFAIGVLSTVLIGGPLVVGLSLRDFREGLKFAGALWVALIAAFGILLFWAWIAGAFNA